MAETADIVIAGAGFAGASTAYHLVRQGVRNILLLEGEATPGLHASGRNAALVFQVLADNAEARLAIEGTRFIAQPPDQFCATPLFRRCGSLLIASAAGMPALQRSATDAERLGLQCELITPNAARKRVSALAGAQFAGGLWNPHDGVVDIHTLLQRFLFHARAGGARTECARRINAVRSVGGCIAAVETNSGPVHTRCLVNAAGAWAGEVGALAGVGTRTLAPRRRHMFRTTTAGIPIAPDWPFVWHNDLDVYFRPEGDGLLMSPCDATPHPPQEPDVDPAMHAVFADKVARAFPALAAVNVTGSWACLRTFARDERFVIGRDPELDGLVWVAALGGHGMSTSPAVGRLGAAAVLGERNAELQRFSPARFA